MDAGGFVVKKLTTETTTRPNISPVWSPDGSRIAFVGASEEGFDLYVMNADGTDITRLTDLPGDETQPAWSPDGDRIAYSWDDLGDPRFRTGISVVNADGTGSTELVSRAERGAVRSRRGPRTGRGSPSTTSRAGPCT